MARAIAPNGMGVCGEQGETDADDLETFAAPRLELFDLEILLAPAE